MQIETGVHDKGTFSFIDAIDNMKRQSGFRKAGAIASFVGVVRGENQKHEAVQKLELEAYEEKANEVLRAICDDLKKKKGIMDVQIHHLLGEFTLGEDMVYVMVAGSHREYIFPVLEEAVERYKKEAPIFKKETVRTKEGRIQAYWTSEH